MKKEKKYAKHILINIILISSFTITSAQWNGTDPVWTNSYLGIGSSSVTSPLTISKPTNHLVPTVEIINTSSNPGCEGCINIGQKISVLDNQGTFKRNIGLWINANNATNNYAAIFENGNVGIGVTDPANKLEVLYGVTSLGWSAIAQFGLASSGMWHNSAHQVVIGGPSILGYTGLIIYSDSNTGAGQISFADGRGNPDSWRGFVQYDHSIDALTFGTNSTEKVRISSLGNVGIGTSNPSYKLDVNGIIHAKEVKVDMNFPADYVFNSDYNLPSLSDVENFIKSNGHLPEVPSASEIQEKGLCMGDMQNKLLQKVEELTLYTIQQEKINKNQSKIIEELKQLLFLQAKEIELLKTNL